ncbi:unnamed protein product [Calypogeia fissa]
MAGNCLPLVELLVRSGGGGSSSLIPSVPRNPCTSIVNLDSPTTASGQDLSAIVDEGALIAERVEEQKRKLLKSSLTDEFRTAIKDHKRLKNLLAKAENHPIDLWRKALLWTSSSGHAEFIAEFIKRRPPGLKTLLPAAEDHDGFTALHRAVIMGQKDVVKILTRSHLGQQNQAQAMAMEDFEILHARTPEGWTSLHLAVVVGDEEMVQILIDSYIALAATVPPDYEWDFADNFWMTPLHYAVLGNWPAVMKQLLDWLGYDRHVNAHDYYMRTAAHMASCSRAGEASIDILVSNPKVDINAVDCCLYTPLHWAVHVGNTETVRCLVARSSERTIRTTEEDIEGRPVFQTAIEHTSLDRKVCKDIEKLLLTSAEVKDEVERLYRDRQVYVDASNAILVGAALIASVTFGGWLQPPGGIINNGGQVDHELQVFWVFNSLSFFFSIATVMAGAGAVLPMEDVYIGRAVKNIRGALGLTSFLLIISVVLVLGAFGASGFGALANAPHLMQNMMVTTSIGGSVCTIILLWFLERLYKVQPNWRRLVSPAIKTCFKHIFMHRHRLDLEDIRTKLEAAEVRAKEELQTRYGRSAADSFHHLDLTELVFALGKASDRALQLRRGHDPGMLMGIADEKGGPLSIRHLKEKVLEQRIVAFERAYEQARMLRTKSGRVQDPNCNMLILSHIGARGLHHWIDEFPSYYCRGHSLEKDATRWATIYGRVVLAKRPKLEEENTKFEYELEYGTLDFEDWAV